jgi:Acetyltransferases, including N-acetylases of ribosomal proteins
MDYTLRKWHLSDIPSLQRHADNPKIAANLTDAFPNPYTLADAEDYIGMCLANDEHASCMRAICVGGDAVGGIGITLGSDVYRKRAELGYWLAEPYWGRGIMPRAVREMCAYAFQTYGLVRIFATPYAYNAASCRVLEKAGFACEGRMRNSAYKSGKVLDTFMYALLKNNELSL